MDQGGQGGRIVALIGQNENGILRVAAQGFMDLLRPSGISGHVVDLHQPDWPARLDALLRDGVLFAWGPAGVGAHLPLDGKNLWDAAGVPFISVLADHPCIMPRNHRVPARHVANGYMVPDWLAVQRRHLHSPQLSALLPLGALPNPHRNAIPWRDRPRRAVFVKSGADPDAWRARWAGFPARLRAVLEAASDAALRAWPTEITDAVLCAAADRGLDLEGRPEALFGLAHEVDTHVRDLRSTLLARALLHLPVEVHGRGWGHLAGQATRAAFHPALDAARLPRLLAESRHVLNTTPNFDRGLHERVANGLTAGCRVVSDANAAARETFAGLDAFAALNVLDPDLPDRLAAVLMDDADHTEAAREGAAVAEREFDGMRFIQALIGLAHEIRTLTGYEPFDA